MGARTCHPAHNLKLRWAEAPRPPRRLADERAPPAPVVAARGNGEAAEAALGPCAAAVTATGGGCCCCFSSALRSRLPCCAALRPARRPPLPGHAAPQRIVRCCTAQVLAHGHPRGGGQSSGSGRCGCCSRGRHGRGCGCGAWGQEGVLAVARAATGRRMGATAATACASRLVRQRARAPNGAVLRARKQARARPQASHRQAPLLASPPHSAPPSGPARSARRPCRAARVCACRTWL